MMMSSRRTTGLVAAETNPRCLVWGADPRHKVTMPLRKPPHDTAELVDVWTGRA